MGAEFRLPFNSPEPIGTIRNKPSHLLMLSRSCKENEDGHVIGRIASLATAVTMLKRFGAA
jgi:hypothetical protein